MVNCFCIILSKYRLYQGIALYRSLEANYRSYRVFILCTDDETYDLCNKLRLDATLIRPEELKDKRLRHVKRARRLNEYCWTLKPFFLEYVLRKYDSIGNAVYLDADLYFFNDPTLMFTSNSNYHVLLSEHDFADRNGEVQEACGKYNSGFIIFKRCKTSLDILKWWKEKCIEWCYDGVNQGRFGDQKYLEQFPSKFHGVQSIAAHGVNIAPWNESKYHFSINKDRVYANDNKLICYHFCGLRLINQDIYALVIGNQTLNNLIHTPYIIAIKQVISDIEHISPEFDGYFVESHLLNKAKFFKMDG